MSDDKVVPIGGEEDHSPAAVLLESMKKDLQFVVVVGTDAEGNVHFAQSDRDSILRVLGALSAAEYYVRSTWDN